MIVSPMTGATVQTASMVRLGPAAQDGEEHQNPVTISQLQSAEPVTYAPPVLAQPVEEPMFCGHCGARRDPEAKFCSECGSQ
jgi:hypothetical protein